MRNGLIRAGYPARIRSGMHVLRRILPLVIALTVAACGASEDKAATKPTSSPRTKQASSPTAAPPAGDPVTITGFEYAPRAATVNLGTRVTWTDEDAANHSVTADDGSFDVGNIRQGGHGSHTFGKAGTFAYHCTYHPSMHGRVVVR